MIGEEKAHAVPFVLVAAGGTGGHLFPAQSLSDALKRRGIAVGLATDVRAEKFSEHFSDVHLVPSATFRGRDPVSIAFTAGKLAVGVAKAYALLSRLKPAIIVGFGGYPTVPTLFAASARKIPTVIHEQNGVMGRANRFLSSRATAIATGFPGILDGDRNLAGKATYVGNPVRPAVIVAVKPYDAPTGDGAFRLLVFGGSQGARIMADIVPEAVGRLEPHLQMRLKVVQQARAEDIERVKAGYARARVEAVVEPFFNDLPQRMAASHLVVSRSGASTVAELSAIGRPAILVPLPHALDQDQAANAAYLERAGGAVRIFQDAFTPDRLAVELAALAADPGRLAAMAQAAKGIGVLDAADRLADLVMKVGGIARP